MGQNIVRSGIHDITGNIVAEDSHYPYQSKSMGLIWQTMAHTWPIYGSDMGWLEHHMGNLWCPNL